MKRIILASASPRRIALLTQIGLSFEIIPSHIEEDITKLSGSPFEKAQALALQKAQDVASRVEEGFVLGADTMVVMNEKILGKPKDPEDAFDMLNRLSGKEHLVVTGVALVDAKSSAFNATYEVTKVRFATLSQERITAYMKKAEFLDKAGAYGIQDMGALLVESIEGCFYNVVGLPIMRVSKMLEDHGIIVL